MSEIASTHRTRPLEVEISAALTSANRGAVARWLEDHGVSVGIPPDGVIIVTTRHGDRVAHLGERVMVQGRSAEILDQAHYALWYEPIEP